LVDLHYIRNLSFFIYACHICIISQHFFKFMLNIFKITLVFFKNQAIILLIE